MKASVNANFDRNLCLRALGVRLTFMRSNTYEYLYHMNFKRRMRRYSRTYRDPFKQHISKIEFFDGNKDPFYQHIYDVHILLRDWQNDFMYRMGCLSSWDDVQDEDILRESWRYADRNLVLKRSKSYDRLKLHFEKALVSYIHVVYRYACVLTVKNHRLPHQFKPLLSVYDNSSLRLLNTDDDHVCFLIDLLAKLVRHYKAVKKLVGGEDTLSNFVFPRVKNKEYTFYHFNE